MGWATSNNQLAALRKTEEGAKRLLEPTKLWYQDLTQLIQEKQRQGHSIMLCGDFNEDLASPRSKVQQLAKDLNMREVITERHGIENAPKTYEYGSKPIDGIFLSDNMNIVKGGYIDSMECPGDHCALWIDIDKKEMIGELQDHNSKRSYRRVTSKIPSVKNTFQTLMEDQINTENLREQVDKLYDRCIQEVKDYNCISEQSKQEMDMLNDRVT